MFAIFNVIFFTDSPDTIIYYSQKKICLCIPIRACTGIQKLQFLAFSSPKQGNKHVLPNFLYLAQIFFIGTPYSQNSSFLKGIANINLHRPIRVFKNGETSLF